FSSNDNPQSWVSLIFFSFYYGLKKVYKSLKGNPARMALRPCGGNCSFQKVSFRLEWSTKIKQLRLSSQPRGASSELHPSLLYSNDSFSGDNGRVGQRLARTPLNRLQE